MAQYGWKLELPNTFQWKSPVSEKKVPYNSLFTDIGHRRQTDRQTWPPHKAFFFSFVNNA
jgi:hypothetical protein